MQARRPEFNPQDLLKKVGMMVCACIPSAREMKAGGSQSLLASQPGLLGEPRPVRNLVSINKVDGT